MKQEYRNYELSPVPTVYNGVQFRSRLEARYAVMFDFINLKWEYEAKSFRLKNDSYYVPDFYFPKWGAYAEVKPTEFTPLEIKKCLEVSKMFDTKNQPDGCIILLDGIPKPRCYQAIKDGEFICNLHFVKDGNKYHPFFYDYDFNMDYFQEECFAAFEGMMYQFK